MRLVADIEVQDNLIDPGRLDPLQSIDDLNCPNICASILTYAIVVGICCGVAIIIISFQTNYYCRLCV